MCYVKNWCPLRRHQEQTTYSATQKSLEESRTLKVKSPKLRKKKTSAYDTPFSLSLSGIVCLCLISLSWTRIGWQGDVFQKLFLGDFYSGIVYHSYFQEWFIEWNNGNLYFRGLLGRLNRIIHKGPPAQGKHGLCASRHYLLLIAVGESCVHHSLISPSHPCQGGSGPARVTLH